MLKTSQKRPFLDTKSAIERARWLETARNLFVVVRVCSPVVLSYLDAVFDPRCVRKDSWIACRRFLPALEHELKTPTFHPKWTTGRHCGAEDAFFITHSQAFDCIIVAQEQQR